MNWGNIKREDSKLAKAATTSSIELGRLRWHWTLDESNDDLVSFTEYAKKIGVSDTPIRRHAHAYRLFMDRGKLNQAVVASVWNECYQRASASQEKQDVAEAIAEETGISVAHALHNQGGKKFKPAEVRAKAEAKAEQTGRSIKEEAKEIVRENIKKAAKEKEFQQIQKKKRNTNQYGMRWVELDGTLEEATSKLKKVGGDVSAALKNCEGVEFNGEELELLADAAAKFSHQVGLIAGLAALADLVISGSTGVDWDAELLKMGGAK